MDKRKFIKSGFLGLGAIAVMPAVVSSCSKDDTENNETIIDSGEGAGRTCQISPVEMVGLFP